MDISFSSSEPSFSVDAIEENETFRLSLNPNTTSTTLNSQSIMSSLGSNGASAEVRVWQRSSSTRPNPRNQALASSPVKPPSNSSNVGPMRSSRPHRHNMCSSNPGARDIMIPSSGMRNESLSLSRFQSDGSSSSTNSSIGSSPSSISSLVSQSSAPRRCGTARSISSMSLSPPACSNVVGTCSRTASRPPSPCPLNECCPDNWLWDMQSKSPQARLLDAERKSVMFHPVWSNGTAGVRGNRMLNGGIYYWEVETGNRLFGTAMMFGIGSDSTSLHAEVFLHDMIGRDRHSFGLSHKGLVWNNGESTRYCDPFREYNATTIGMLFDGVAGTLEFWKDGDYLGVGFRDLHKIQAPLYPMISSTAAKTVMTVKNQYRAFYSLQDRCRFVILEAIAGSNSDNSGSGVPSGAVPVVANNGQESLAIQGLPLPARLRHYLLTGI